MPRSLVGVTRAGLRLLFPPRCVCCDAELLPPPNGLLLCADCCLVLGPKLWPGCAYCGAAGAAGAGKPP